MEKQEPYCDRRLSRAAREIVEFHLKSAYHYWDEGEQTTSSSIDVSDWNVWQLLDKMLLHHDASSGSGACPLSRPDVWKEDEVHSLKIPATVPKSVRSAAIPGILHAANLHRTKGKRSNAAVTVFYQCGKCHKNFTSQYYLDQHFDTQHPPPVLVEQQDEEEASSLSSTRLTYSCPAVDWCRFLSHQACHDTALQLEPYYGRGGGGGFGQRSSSVVHRSLVKQANERPCTANDMQAAHNACLDMLQQCFGGNSTVIGRRLEQTLCAAQSCHGRLHKLLSLATSAGNKQNSVMWMMHHPHGEWQDAWTEHAHHGLGVVGLVLVAAVACYYVYRCLFSSSSPRRPILAPSAAVSGNRLLRKNPTKHKKKSWHLAPSAPTTFIGHAKSKQQ